MGRIRPFRFYGRNSSPKKRIWAVWGYGQPEPPLLTGAGVLNGMGYLPAMERFSTSTLGEPKVVIPMGMGKVMLLPTAVIFWSSS